MKAMKRKLLTIVAIISLLVMPLSVCAQSLTLPQEREFLLEALKLLDEYEYNANVRSTQSAGTFVSLFSNPEIMLYNDLLGLSEAEELPLEEYVTLLRNNAISPIVKLKNVRRSGIKERNDSIIMTFYFDKELRYNNNCGAILSSKAYYDKDYEMEMEVAMDKDSKEIVILSLKGNIASDKPRLGKDFAIIEKGDKRDLEVTNNGQKLNFNAFDQAFVPLPYNLIYPDYDENMTVLVGGEDCNKLTLKYHPRRFIIKPRVNISLGKSFNIDDSNPLIDVKSSSMEFGVDFGYVLPMKGNFKINVLAGLGYSTGKIELETPELNYNYQAGANADMDGVPYTRYYELSNLNQKISLGHLVIPIYADFEYRFGKIVSAFAQVGVRMYANAGSKVDNFSGSMYSYGVYPEYDDLMINAPYMNDFGHSTFDANSITNLQMNGMSLDGFFGLGIRAKLYGPLSIEAGINYQMGFMNMISVEGNPGTLSSGSITESQALATYTVAGGTNIHSLTDYVGDIKRSSLKLNVGLIFKF